MKKIFFVFLMIITITSAAFGEFEIGINVPFDVNFSHITSKGEKNYMTSLPPYAADFRTMDGYIGFDIAVLLQIGGSFKTKYESGLTSVSLLAELGYQRHSYGYLYKASDIPDANPADKYTISENAAFDTIQIGILPKFNLYNAGVNGSIPMSVGIGAGVLIPCNTRVSSKVIGFSSANNKENFDYIKTKYIFKYPFIPYIKLTLDSYYYVSKNTAITVGSYIGYNFGMKYDTDILNAASGGTLRLSKYQYGAFFVGISVGFYFGRENPRYKNTKAI